MQIQPPLLEQLLGDSLRFEYIEAAVSDVAFPYNTGMRVMPFAVINIWHGEVLLEVAEAPAVTVPAWATIVLPAGVAHRITVLRRPNMACHWVHGHYTVFSVVDLLTLLHVPYVLPPAIGHRCADIMAQLLALPSPRETVSWGDLVRRKELGFSLLTQLLSQAPPQQLDAETLGDSRRLMTVLQYIQDHLADEIARSDLAHLIALSPTHFHTLFKRTLGMAPMEYVKQLRIRHAQRLLVETPLPVAQVAEQVGFHDPFHFSRIFKATCAMSPSQYRQAIRASLISDATC